MKMTTKLAEYVQKHNCFEKAQRAFVSVYKHHRCYGGPEEGGWWYDRMELIGSVEFPEMYQAEDWLANAKSEVEDANRAESPMRCHAMASLPNEDEEACPCGGSEGYIPTGWDDGGEYVVVIETNRGQADNMDEPRPHYE